MTEQSAQLDDAPDGSSHSHTGIDIEKARRGSKLLLEAVGEDPGEEPLRETWQRRVPELVETLTEGSREEAKPTLRTFEEEADQLIVKTAIPVYSLCEHHLLPYHGVAHVGYHPGTEVIGLSKLPRYVRWQSRRLTTQEGLTEDIAAGLRREIEADSVMVQISAEHLCEAMRGVETATETTTRAVVGDPTERDREQFETVIENV